MNNSPPDKADWLPSTMESDLDEGYAIRNFIGKTFKQAVDMFRENSLIYSEDLLYMPPVPLRFYLRAFCGYIKSESSRGDSDAASCLLSVLEYIAKQDFNSLKPIWGIIISTIDYVAERQEFYDASTIIYGSFFDKCQGIKAYAHQDDAP